jgi:cysteine desulfurase
MIYLDNNATTPLHPSVKEKIINALELYGNPSSAHDYGRNIRSLVENAREEIAGFLNCGPDEIIFTASGSEANNTVLKSSILCNAMNSCDKGEKLHIISTKIEHPSVLNTLRCLENQKVEVTYLPVDSTGLVDPADVEMAIRPETALISIMWANNEIGTIQPIEEIGLIAKKHKILFHTDAVQAVGKVDIDLSKSNIDYLSLSGHKIYAPKGIGVLYKKNSSRKLCPLINGGHQEHSLRAGTENTIGILALGEAFRQLRKEMKNEIENVRRLRDKLEKGIFESVSHVKLNGHPVRRLPGTSNISFLNVEGESILLRLDLHGIAVSTGSACSSGSLEPSHVIMALGVDAEIAHSSIRFSLGRENTDKDVEKTVIAVKETISFLRQISPIKLSS